MTRYAPPEENHDLRITTLARAIAEGDPQTAQLVAAHLGTRRKDN